MAGGNSHTSNKYSVMRTLIIRVLVVVGRTDENVTISGTRVDTSCPDASSQTRQQQLPSKSGGQVEQNGHERSQPGSVGVTPLLTCPTALLYLAVSPDHAASILFIFKQTADLQPDHSLGGSRRLDGRRSRSLCIMSAGSVAGHKINTSCAASQAKSVFSCSIASSENGFGTKIRMSSCHETLSRISLYGSIKNRVAGFDDTVIVYYYYRIVLYCTITY